MTPFDAIDMTNGTFGIKARRMPQRLRRRNRDRESKSTFALLLQLFEFQDKLS